MDIKILYWEINSSSIGLKKLEPIQIQSSEKKTGGVGIGDWDWLLVVVVLSEEGTWRTCVMGSVRGQFTVQGVT